MLVKPLVRSIVRSIAGVPTNSLGSGFSPLSLFTAGTKGVVYDNNDFVDSATWRRNLLTYSEQFDNAVWLTENGTTASNVAISPDGATTAERYTEDGTSSIHGFRNNSAIPVTGQSTFSVYLKNESRRWVSVAVNTGAGYSDAVIVDLTNGQITQTIGSFDSSPTVLSAGNGWYRVVLVKTLPAASNFFYISGASSAAPGIARSTYLGNGSNSFLAWGAQLELGSTATTYQRITNFNSDFLAAFPRTTLYEDAAGTIPTRVNGLVGLQLDKSANLALGAEIKSSGAIGIIGTATAATYNTTTGEGSVTRVDGVNQSFVQWSGLATSSWYLLTIQNTGANALNIRSGGSAGAVWLVILAGETKSVYVPELGNLVTITSASAATATFTLSTIKQISGNHRYQTTTGSKPVLRGTPVGSSLVTNGDFATDTVWTKDAGWTISSGTASKAAGSAANIAQSLVLDAGRIVRVSYTIASISGGAVFIRLIGGAVVDGASRTTAGTFVEYLTVPASMTSFAIRGASTTVATIDNIEVVDVSAGQVTAPYGLQYDGVDDFLQTAAVDFTATDKMFVCAGVRKLSDAAVGALVELSSNVTTNAGAFAVFAPLSTALQNFNFQSAGSALSSVSRNDRPAPTLRVLTCIGNISGDTASLTVSGEATVTSTADQGTGNFGNYAFYFGRRGGTSFPLNGLDFGFVICGKTLTSNQISSTERYIAQRTGIAL